GSRSWNGPTPRRVALCAQVYTLRCALRKCRLKSVRGPRPAPYTHSSSVRLVLPMKVRPIVESESLAGTVSVPEDRIEVRSLRTHRDFTACVELQRITWGAEYNEIVPPIILKITQKVGGVAAGAFDESGRMLGCVYGITGVE